MPFFFGTWIFYLQNLDIKHDKIYFSIQFFIIVKLVMDNLKVKFNKIHVLVKKIEFLLNQNLLSIRQQQNCNIR